MRKIIAVMIVAMVGLTGCGSDTSEPTGKERIDRETQILRKNIDGKELMCYRDSYYGSVSCNWEAYNAAS